VKRYRATGESLFSSEKAILEAVVDHPGTVKLTGVFESEDGRRYFIMENEGATALNLSDALGAERLKTGKWLSFAL
jgi:hypothetical protein